MDWLQIKDISIENNLAIMMNISLKNQGKALYFTAQNTIQRNTVFTVFKQFHNINSSLPGILCTSPSPYIYNIEC